MGVIFAKHPGENKEYLFAVKEGQWISKGDWLCVDTVKGKTVAIATSNMIEGDTKKVAELAGAYLPLKPVLTYANDILVCAIHDAMLQPYRDALGEMSRLTNYRPPTMINDPELPF